MEEQSGTGEKALFFVLGAFIGAATALLLAPRSGEDTRKILASKAREGADKTSTYFDRGKEILQQQRDHLSAAFEAGKQAYRDEKDKAQI
jgi:gas vesicle protein